MYDQWKLDPNSVHSSWRSYFNNIDKDVAVPFDLPPTQTENASIQKILGILQSGGLSSQGSGQGAPVDTSRAVREAY
jgi:2-oxoglutarate dehydrogenase complex dehydrogenase (E1) component-like enzyme